MMKKTLAIIFATLLICAGFIAFRLFSFEKTNAGNFENTAANKTPVEKKRPAATTRTINGNLNISGNLNVTTAPEARWKTYTNNTYGFSVRYPYGTAILENGVTGADVNFNDGNVEALIVGGSSYCKESLNANEVEKVGGRIFRVSRTPFTAYYYYNDSNGRCFRFIFRQLSKDAEKADSLIDSYLTTFKVI